MSWLRRSGVLVACAAVYITPSARGQTPGSPAQAPYRDASLPVPARVRDLLGRMTLEEKFWQLFMIPGDLDDSTQDYSHGVFGLQISVEPRDHAPLPAAEAARAHAQRINAIQRSFVERTRLGIPIIPFEEAVHGLSRGGATVFPAAIGLAATWDTALVGRVARTIALETRSRGIRQVLSPVVNIASDVRWGRVEETYGEDPYLSSEMARAFVAAMEHGGIVATPKHFVANVGAGGRDSYPIDFDQRLLDEMFFPPFEAAIRDAGARSIMSGYNSVDGVPATQSRALLTDKLRRDWGFTGFVISDEAATGGATVLHDTERNTATATKDALDAGLDVIFQAAYSQYRPYLEAFRRGSISDSVIDSAVARVLRVKFELGLFEHPYVDPDSAALANGSAANRALALDAEREAMVLLRNEHELLPLSKGLRSVAVIGVDAVQARLGGYSGPGVSPISILDGIRQKVAASVAVRYTPGPGRDSLEYAVVPSESLSPDSAVNSEHGLQGEYFDNTRLEGRPRVTRTDQNVDFHWTFNAPARGIATDWYSVRWTGIVTAPRSGVRRIGVEGNDGYRLYLDGHLAIDNWRKQSYRTLLVAVQWRARSRHTIRLEYYESAGNARVRLVWDDGTLHSWPARIDSAVRIARTSSVAVIVAGIEEGEFRDRAHLDLPGHQEELIERVAATGTPVVVVLVGGSAITMSHWIGRTRAVLDVWYPGEQGGAAVADALFGDTDPAGRLPVTFPMFEGQLPLIYDHKPTGRGDDYIDLTGQPLFPFGFGLSYTSFQYSNLVIEPEVIAHDGSAVVRCQVTNTGARAGDEVPQLYIRDVLASVARPVMQLEGFTRVHLAPGESREITFSLTPAELHMLDASMHWVVEPGTFRIMVGSSSNDIRLRGHLTVQ